MNPFFTGFVQGVKTASSLVSTLVNSILLLAVYVIGIGAPSLIARAVGKHFLDSGKEKTYWKDISPEKKSLENYYRQF